MITLEIIILKLPTVHNSDTLKIEFPVGKPERKETSREVWMEQEHLLHEKI